MLFFITIVLLTPEWTGYSMHHWYRSFKKGWDDYAKKYPAREEGE